MKPCYIVMGVSGSGKSTIGKMLAEQIDVPFFDADDFHPPANIAKMSSGIPLNDEDRLPWLKALNRLLLDQNDGAVLACSALKKSYRKVLRQHLTTSPRFIFLAVSRDFLLQRMTQRTDHFMPKALLDSQLATLEKPVDALQVDGHLSPDQIIAFITKNI